VSAAEIETGRLRIPHTQKGADETPTFRNRRRWPRKLEVVNIDNEEQAQGWMPVARLPRIDGLKTMLFERLVAVTFPKPPGIRVAI
jgi:hypothetical protein